MHAKTNGMERVAREGASTMIEDKEMAGESEEEGGEGRTGGQYDGRTDKGGNGRGGQWVNGWSTHVR